MEIEVKQRGTYGAWLRPGFKQQPTHVNKGSSSDTKFKSVASSREQQVDDGASVVDDRNMFCLLETTIYFIHASLFYFDRGLLQYRLQYESYSYNI
jgi:hypothetical protein